MTFFRSLGSASHSSSYVEYMYAVRVANSAAQVSTRLYTGRMPSACRRARTSPSLTLRRCASRRSEKPLRFSSRRSSCASDGSVRLSSTSSRSTISLICARNHGSIFVCAWISSSVMPMPNASATYQSRSPRGYASSSPIVSGSTVFRLKPSTPVSSPRSAFCSDSWNVRPIAMTSPTDFICVVSRSSACLNFSNANRGTFVTT